MLRSPQNLVIDLTCQENIVGLFSAYKLLGKWAGSNVKGLETMLQALLLIQATVTATFFSFSFFSPDSITLNITSYVLVESIFVLFVILQSLRACVNINETDKLFRLKCLEICALLDFDDTELGTGKSAARAFRGITTYLDRANIVEAKLFGVHLSKQLIAKIMISFLAATGSALLRSGIS